MSPTVVECLEHVRQCEWYADRTSDEADRKFLLKSAKQWKKLAVGRTRNQSLCTGCRLQPLQGLLSKAPVLLGWRIHSSTIAA